MDTDNTSSASAVLFEERQINDNGIDKEVNEAHKTLFMNDYKHIDIHDNEDTAGMNISNIFNNLKAHTVLALGLTQSGKTRTMLATIKHCIMNDIVPLDNILIITSLSSRDWKADTEKLLPYTLKRNILHLPDFYSKTNNEQITNDFANKNNILIIIDESHIASNSEQVMGKIFAKSGILNEQEKMKRDIKIVQFTATPNAMLYDTLTLKYCGYHIYTIEPGEGYKSVFDLYESGRVKEYKDLGDKNSSIEYIKEIQIDIQHYYPNHKKYHFIRTHSKNGIQDIIISNFQTVFGNDCEYLSHNEKDKYDINEKLKEEPKQHTFIFIKEKFRCAKVLNKTYVGICYERKTKKPDYSVIIQGLLGRCSGYNDSGSAIIYTNIDAIFAYQKLWDSKFQDIELYWTWQGLNQNTKKNQKNEVITLMKTL